MISNGKLGALAVLVMGLGACASVGGAGRSGAVDVRGTAAVEAQSPRLIAVGPVRLLHVDVHGNRPVNVYSAVRNTGTDADCRVARPAGVAPLHENRRNPIDVDVPDGQVVCVAPVAGAASTPRPVEVAWHARREGGMPAGTLALDAGDR
jgi:hypothetical protein